MSSVRRRHSTVLVLDRDAIRDRVDLPLTPHYGIMHAAGFGRLLCAKGATDDYYVGSRLRGSREAPI